MTAHHISISPTGSLRELAHTLRAQGRDIVDLTAGQLEMPTPPHIVEAAVAAARDHTRHGYGSAAGDPELRDAVVHLASRSLHIHVEKSQVAITNGAKQALHNALRSLVGVGDEVIVAAPYWVTFPEAVRLAGATPVFARPVAGQVLPGVDEFDRVRTQATRAILLCSPHNPTGGMHALADLEQILRWAARHHIWVISDDTYRDLAYTEIRSTPELAIEAGCDVVSIGSTSKSHAMTGWRTGWIIAPPEVTATAVAIQSHTSSNVARVTQAAAVAALNGPDVAADTRSRLRQLRDQLMGIFADAGVHFPAPDGAFYLFPPITRLADDDAEAARLIIEKANAVVVPGTAFGAPGHVRISYAGAHHQVVAGAQRVADLLRSVS